MRTARLQLTQFQETDADFMLRLLRDPGWVKYIGPRDFQGLDDAETYIKSSLRPQYQHLGMGLMKLQRLPDLVPIGLCGLLQRETLPAPDLGFALLEAYTGQGYAFEAAHHILALADAELKLKRILAITQINNQASIALLKKLGFDFDCEWGDLWRFVRQQA